jgi:type IV fimbrial biogenesis protein FimT
MAAFSLLELLLALSIASILLAVTIPSYQIFLSTSSEQALANQLLTTINFARTQAYLLGVPVTLCAGGPALSCQGSWQEKLMIFKDEMKIAKPTTSTDIIQIIQPAKVAGVLHWRSALHQHYLRFYPSGYTHAADGTFWFCAAQAKFAAWEVVVSASGRARLVQPNQNDKLLDCGI